jgi:putative ABC transport system permease protein
VIAAVLISGVYIIGKQISYMKDYDMGFSPEDVVAVPMVTEAVGGEFQKVNAFFNEVNLNRDAGGIVSVAASENIPGDHFNNTFGVLSLENGNSQPVQMVVSSMDENFVETYGIKLLEGRNFSAAHSTDREDAVIINQTAARVLGWTNAVGKQLRFTHDSHPLTVIGVMKDINIASLQSAVEPMVYRYAAGYYQNDYLSARLDPSRIPQGLNALKQSWHKIFPTTPFEYYFVKDKYDSSYEPEVKTEKIIEVFSTLAIFLAGLGLFGLASLKVTQRTKEIGVRKVLGATIPDLVKLFTKEFILLALLGNLVAIPVSYYFLNRWLQGFAYRTSIGAGVFVAAASLTLLVAFLTVSLQAIRAALANPVEALRYE